MKNILKRAKIKFNLNTIKLADSFPFPKENDLKSKKALEKLP